MRWLVVLFAACSPYDPQLPAQPFLCGSTEPKCPDGYTCVASGTQLVCATTTPMDNIDGSIPPGNCAKPVTGMLASWDFTAAPGSQQSTGPLTMATGLVAGPVSRSPALMPSDGTNSINASNWPTSGSIDPASYFTLTLTPPAGCAMDITSMALDIKSSGTGPTSAAIATSADTFSHTSSASTTAPSTPTLTVSNQAGAVEIRIYGFAAQAATGTMRIENQLGVTGSLH